MDALAPVVTAARYAKGRSLARCPSDGSGYKTRAMRLAEALGGRWVHRGSGYIMSPRRAEQLLELYAAGWDATSVTAKLLPPEGAEIPKWAQRVRPPRS